MPEPNSQSPAPVFQQSNWTVQGSVYNVAGDLILSQQSSTPDFLKALDELKRQIQDLQELDPERHKELRADLDAVARETTRDKPSKGVIVGRLATVQATLEATKDTVKGAWGVAQTVAQVAGWAAAFFG